MDISAAVDPDLTRIGGTRTERDLLESIVFPSLSFVRSYEPVTIVTTEGKVHNGLVRLETTDEITLATGPKEEVHFPSRRRRAGPHPLDYACGPGSTAHPAATGRSDCLPEECEMRGAGIFDSQQHIPDEYEHPQ